MNTRTADAWLASDNIDKISATSIYRNDPSPPQVVGQSQYINGGTMGKRYHDFSEPVSGFSEDSTPLEIHPPATQKPYQRRRPPRGMCYCITRAATNYNILI